MEYLVNFEYDNEAQVWIATSNDIKGLILEGGSLDALQERVRYAIGELVTLNKKVPSLDKQKDAYLDIHFASFRREKVAING